MNEEVDVIQHLIEIEKEAATLIAEKQKEADKLISEARTQSEAQFKEKYSIIVQELEAENQAKKESINQKYRSDVEEYKENLSKTAKNQKSFEESLKPMLQ